MPVEFQLADRSTTPPGGWRWVQPESGRVFQHYSRDAFYKEIQAHRLGNGYEITPTWREEIEDQLCRDHPEWGRQICKRTQPLGPRKPISFAALQSFLNVIVAWIQNFAAGRDPFVDQAEADRRAAICTNCEFNANLGFSCGACADIVFRALSGILGGTRSTPYDEHLGGCSICSCALKVAVWTPLEVQQRGLNEELREEFKMVPWCWKKENL